MVRASIFGVMLYCQFVLSVRAASDARGVAGLHEARFESVLSQGYRPELGTYPSGRSSTFKSAVEIFHRLNSGLFSLSSIALAIVRNTISSHV